MIVINKSLSAKNARLKIDQLLLLEINRIQQAQHSHRAVSRIVWTPGASGAQAQEHVLLAAAPECSGRQLVLCLAPFSRTVLASPPPPPRPCVVRSARCPVRAQSSFSGQAVRAGSSTALLPGHSLGCVTLLSPGVGRHTPPLNIGSQGSNQTYPASSYYAIAGGHTYVCCANFKI